MRQFLMIGVSAIGLIATSAFAQDAATQSSEPEGLTEIVVSAQKRDENLQDVPIAISALGAEALAQKGITGVDDIAGFVPNVEIKNTVSFAGSSQILVASIRGIGQNDFAFNLEPGVGVYIDGVYYARSLGAVVDLLDLQRIEVLKGPQGTLFGRNTIGGALNIVTRRPDNNFGYQMEATTGRFARTDVRGSVDIPLAETLLSQFSFSYKHRNGYQRRLPFPAAAGKITDRGSFRTAGPVGGSDTQGGENVFNARTKLEWKPAAGLTFLLAADYTRADQEARPTTLLATFAGPTDGTALAAYNGCLFGAAPPFVCSTRGTVNTSYFGVNVDSNPNNDRLPFTDALITKNIDTNYSNGSNFDKLTSWGVSLDTDYELAADHSIKSITAFRKLSSQFGAEITGSPFVANDASFDMRQEQFSQELQLSSKLFEGRLKSVIGLYYFQESGSLLDTPIIGEGLIQIFGPNDFDNKAWAVFANEEFAITDRWGLTFGIRYSEETKKFEGQQRDLNSFFLRTRGIDPSLPLTPAQRAILPIPSDQTRIFPVGRQQLNFSDVSIRLGTQYKVTDDVLAYYSYSQGFKSGGFTTRLLDLVAGPNPNDISSLIFRPESADTHEIGLKSKLFDNHLRLNMAAFSTKFTDIQITTFNGISPVFSNAGEAKLDGFEAEAEARVGNLNLNAGIGYLDARYTKLGAGATISINNDLVNAPKWTVTAGGNYNIDIGSAGSRIMLGANYNYRSAVSPDAENSPYLRAPGVGIVNTSIGFHAPEDAWALTFGVTNLTDERFIVGGFDQSKPGQIGYVGGSYSPPQQWYLTLRVKG
jgi:iron complex outermembrane receptor protein